MASLEHMLGLATVPHPNDAAESLWPRQPSRGWRKWAWRHYQVARRVYRRAVWAARLAYVRAAWAAGLARLMLRGALSLATLVNWMTRSQLRRIKGAA